MPGKEFVDTNILIYAYSKDEPKKQSTANDILEKHTNSSIISNQVIHELVNILFKKFKLSSDDIENVLLEIDTNLTIINFNFTTQIKAIRIKDKYKLQYYDSLIIAAAMENGCNILFSEDMQHLQVIEESLQIINPFYNTMT